MRLAAQYSFKNGLDEITVRYPHLLAEVKDAIRAVDASQARTKLSREKTKVGRMLYSLLILGIDAYSLQATWKKR